MPIQKVDTLYLESLDKKTEQEAMKKCVICMSYFEGKEIIKTLPCCKNFY